MVRNGCRARPGTRLAVGLCAAALLSGGEAAAEGSGTDAVRSLNATQLAQAQSGQKQSDWTYTGGATVYYDSFESDDGLIESDQVSEIFSLTADRENLWYSGDLLSLSANIGFVQAWPERAGREKFVDATPTDIQLSADYSTWDRKTSGVTASLFVNLPTGPDDLNLTELAAIPNEHVVSVPVLSDGLQIGGEAQYHRKLDDWHLHGGLGYLFRTGVGRLDDFEIDEFEGGHDVSVLAGAEYQINERLNVGVDVDYTYSFENEGSDNHFVSVAVPALYKFRNGQVELAYTFSYSSSESGGVDRPFRLEDSEDFFLDGLHHTVSLEVAYQLSKPLIVRGVGEVSLGDAKRPDDPAFFATDNRYYLGVGGEYTLAQNITLQGLLKYFEVSTEGANGGSTTFDGVSAMLGLRYGF